MKVIDTLRRSNRSLLSAKARTILTALAIGVGAFALTLTLSASNGAERFVNQIVSDNFDPAELIVSADEAVFNRVDTSKPQEYDESFGEIASQAGATTQIKQIDAEDIEKISQVDGVDSVREGVSVSLKYLTREGQKKYVGVVGTFSPYQKPDLLAGEIPESLGNRQILLPEGYLSSLGFVNPEDAVGKTVRLVMNKSTGSSLLAQAQSEQGINISQESLMEFQKEVEFSEDFTIVAVLKKPVTSQPGTELYMYAGIEDTKRLNDIIKEGTPGFQKYSYIFVRVKDGENESKLIEVQNKLKDMGYEAQSVKDTQEFLNQIIGVLRGIVITFGLIALIASVFGVINTMYISVLQRTREIGLMKALGMRKRDVGRLFRFEAAWIGFIGGAIGSLLAFVIGSLMNPWITKKLELGDDSLLVFDIKQIVVLIFLLVLVAIFAGLLPARKATKLDPIEALRTE
ncbi:ABC transporter permease [Candidatus Saccharibacteria bacterium]|nr:ABC transporter permease [Candidatus Saccharibacteria bacterium]